MPHGHWLLELQMDRHRAARSESIVQMVRAFWRSRLDVDARDATDWLPNMRILIAVIIYCTAARSTLSSTPGSGTQDLACKAYSTRHHFIESQSIFHVYVNAERAPGGRAAVVAASW